MSVRAYLPVKAPATDADAQDVAKKGKAASSDDTAASADSGEVDPKAAKKAKKNRRRRLGPATVARPCLFGAAILTLLGTILPR